MFSKRKSGIGDKLNLIQSDFPKIIVWFRKNEKNAVLDQ
jgi:hypothetical protein